MAHDPFSGLNAFVAAAQTSSFTQAAKQLGQTASAISKAVARLEAELGVKLFHRSSKAMTLTSEGAMFFEQCKGLVETAENAKAVISGNRLSNRGHLRAAIPVSFGQHVLAPNLARWQADNPQVSLDIELTDRNVDLIQEHFDLAFCFHKVPDKRIVAKALTTPKFITAASPNYWNEQGYPQAPEDLTQFNCLGFVDPHTKRVRPWQFTQQGRVISHRPGNKLVADQGNFLLAMAKNSGGVIHAPQYLLQGDLNAGNLVAVLPDYESFGPEWSLIYPYQRRQSNILNSLVVYITQLTQQLC